MSCTTNCDQETTTSNEDDSPQEGPRFESLPRSSSSLAKTYADQEAQSYRARTQESSNCPQKQDYIGQKASIGSSTKGSDDKETVNRKKKSSHENVGEKTRCSQKGYPYEEKSSGSCHQARPYTRE